MGEVHRATDTKLGRDVALKVLPRTSRMFPTTSSAALGGRHLVVWSLRSALQIFYSLRLGIARGAGPPERFRR
jgi:hypothetical protein